MLGFCVVDVNERFYVILYCDVAVGDVESGYFVDAGKAVEVVSGRFPVCALYNQWQASVMYSAMQLAQ